jgi:hypothetical protein
MHVLRRKLKREVDKLLFIITEKASKGGGGGVMRDRELMLNFKDVEDSHTLGGAVVPQEREVERRREVSEWEG